MACKSCGCPNGLGTVNNAYLSNGLSGWCELLCFACFRMARQIGLFRWD